MTSLIDAIRINIQNMNDDTPTDPISPIKWTTSQKFGFTKVICMENRNIANIGDADEIANIGALCEELDLGSNKINSFEQIFVLLDSLPNLVMLNLSHNPLGDRSSKKTSYIPLNRRKESKYTNLRVLVLNATFINWSTVFDLLCIFPKLETLHVALNNFGELSGHINDSLSDNPEVWPMFPNIKELFYSHNGPLDWLKNVQPLNLIFPNLRNLVLLGNDLKEIPPYEGIAYNFLPNLNSLSLQDTQISALKSFENVCDWLPTVNSLKVGTRLPIFLGKNVDDYRKDIISRMPNVELLNCTPISAIERERAERALLRESYNLSQADRPRRFLELEEKHGHLDALAEIDLSPNRQVTVTVEFNGVEKSHTLKTDLSFGQAKEEMVSLFEESSELPVNRRHLRMFYFDQELYQVQGPEELRSSSRKIYSLQPMDGDRFLLEAPKPRAHTNSSSS